MNYKLKYFKYKKKYIQLKGGAAINKDLEEPEWFNKEIMFNLLLVINEARPSFLLEMANINNKYPNIKPEEVIKFIIKQYGLKFSIESTVNDNPHRIYFYKEKLISSGTKEEDIAINLGFICKGIPDKKNPNVSIHYKIDNENFYTEICTVELYESHKQLFENKLKEFINIAKTNNVGNVKMDIHYLVNIQTVYLKLLNKEDINENEIEELKNELLNLGFYQNTEEYGNFINYIKNKKYIDNLHIKKWIKFFYLFDLYNINDNYPVINTEQELKINSDVNEYFKKYPMDLYSDCKLFLIYYDSIFFYHTNRPPNNFKEIFTEMNK